MTADLQPSRTLPGFDAGAASPPRTQIVPAGRGLVAGEGVVLYGGVNRINGARILPQTGTAGFVVNDLGLAVQSGSSYWQLPADQDTDAPDTAITLAVVFRINDWGGADAGLVGRPISGSSPLYAYAFIRYGSGLAIRPYFGFQDNTALSPSGIALSSRQYYTAVARWETGEVLEFEVYEMLTGKKVGAANTSPKSGALKYTGAIQSFRVGRSQGSAEMDVDVSAVIVSPRRWTDAEVRVFVDRPFFFTPPPPAAVLGLATTGQVAVAGTAVSTCQALDASATIENRATRATLSLEQPHRITLTLAPLHTITPTLTEAAS